MKTIKEAAKEIFPNPDPNQITAFELGVEFAQRWIPVEEELPEDSLNVIDDKYIDEVICKGYYTNSTYGHMLLKRVKIDQWKWNCGGAFTVTHWRPIELI